MPKYALFKDGKQLTKAHSTKEAAAMEAFEAKYAYWEYADFRGKNRIALEPGCKIRQLPEERGTENSTGTRGDYE